MLTKFRKLRKNWNEVCTNLNKVNLNTKFKLDGYANNNIEETTYKLKIAITFTADFNIHCISFTVPKQQHYWSALDQCQQYVQPKHMAMDIWHLN